MGRLEELEQENTRLKSDRRASDDQNWRTLFQRLDEYSRTCSACQTKMSGLNKSVSDLQDTVYGQHDAPGLKGDLADLKHDASQMRWLWGALAIATITALAEKIVDWGSKLFKG